MSVTRDKPATSESFESLRALLSDAGYTFVEPPIVHDAAAFVELAGEDLRRRLLLTSSADGKELALRPDYTIPVCLMHLAAGEAGRAADYAYFGPVFRQRPDGQAEFLQSGVESLGRRDPVGADADVFKLALDSVDLFALRETVVQIGDSGLFAAVIDALDLSPPWRQRLARVFGDTPRLKSLLAGASKSEKSAGKKSDKAAIRKRVEKLFANTGLATLGARTTEEIVNRAVEKAALAKGIGSRASRVLGDYLAISGSPENAIADVSALSRLHKLKMDKAIDRFTKRMEAMAARKVDTGRLTFAADFGRRLDYYTGFVFEVHDGRRPGRPIVGGGRYDRLLSLIGSPSPVPAVGFAMWLDRIEAAR